MIAYVNCLSDGFHSTELLDSGKDDCLLACSYIMSYIIFIYDSVVYVCMYV